MLKGISPLIPPELLKILAEMGHGDEIVLGDANFPAAAMGKRVVRCDGVSIPAMLDAILPLFPLDTYAEKQAALMDLVPGDTVDPVIWKDIEAVLARHQPEAKIEWVERFAYYDRAREAFAVVQTGETAQYANVILKKGVVK